MILERRLLELALAALVVVGGCSGDWITAESRITPLLEGLRAPDLESREAAEAWESKTPEEHLEAVTASDSLGGSTPR